MIYKKLYYKLFAFVIAITILSSCKGYFYNRSIETFIDTVIMSPTLLKNDTNMIDKISMHKFPTKEWLNNKYLEFTILYLREFRDNYQIDGIHETGSVNETVYTAFLSQKTHPLNSIYFRFEIANDTIYLIYVQPMKLDVK